MTDVHDLQPSAAGELLALCLDAPRDQRAARLAELCAAHPERAPALRDLYALLDGFGLAHEPPPEPGLRERFGPYRVLELLGSGGMGMVWLAEHEGLGRRVALKVLHGGLVTTDKARERFRREALAAAKLDHPGICPVYEVGSADGVPYLAMRHVPGRSLQQWIADSRLAKRSPVALPRRTGDGEQAAVLRLVEQAAQALHAAHEVGLVHRDVKPGNLLVTPEGEPVLVDFGLALSEDSDATGGGGPLTLTGDQVGTPSYMAPEQVGGGVVDRRTDVHALGVVLYECLTLRLPFDAPNRHDLQSQILHDDAPDPRTTHRGIGRELWTVLQTALAKEPARRYRSAAAFAEDLRRLRMHEPILARRAGPGLRLSRFVRRHPVAAGFSAVLAAALAVVLVLLGEREEALAHASSALRTAQASEQALRANEVGSNAPLQALVQALAAVDSEQNLDTVAALQSALVRDHQRLELRHAGAVWMAEYDPRNELLLTCADDRTAKLWNRRGECVATLPSAMPVVWAEWQPGGEHFVTVSFDGWVVIASRDGTPRHRWRFDERDGSKVDFVAAWFDPRLSSAPVVARFAPDGASLAITTLDRKVHVYDVASGKRIGEPFPHRGPVGMPVWSRTGWLATLEDVMDIRSTDVRFELRLWRPGVPHDLVDVRPLPDSAPWGDFSPDGNLLVVACRDGNAWLFDLRERGKPPIALPHQGPVYRCNFSPDGNHIVTGSFDSTVRVWTNAGTNVRTVAVDSPVFEAMWASNGSRVLVGSLDGTVRLFDAELHELLVLRGHRARVTTVRMAPDGRSLLTASWDHTARLWELADPRMPRLLGHNRRVRCLADAGDGRLVSVSDDRTLRAWDLGTGASTSFAVGLGPMSLVLDRERASALVGHDDAVARRYDLRTGKLLAEFPDEHGIKLAAVFLQDGSVLTSGMRKRRTLWNADGTNPREWGEPRGGARTYSLDGQTPSGLLAAVGWGSHFTVWDANGARLTHEPIDPTGKVWAFNASNAVAFSPDESLLAIGSRDKARVFGLQGGVATDPKHPVELDSSGGHVLAVKWSPDGRLLATGCSDGGARLWDTGTWELQAVLRGHRGAVNALLFLADGRLVTAGDDGAIQVWVTSTEEAKVIARQRVGR